MEMLKAVYNPSDGTFHLKCTYKGCKWAEQLNHRGIQSKGQSLNNGLLHWYDAHLTSVVATVSLVELRKNSKSGQN